MKTGSVLGRRDRNKAAKKAAITHAAAALFAEHGYAGTTTQQVAHLADVAEGTLFRYAGSKPELLLMVINEHLRPLVSAETTLGERPVEDKVLDLLGPLIDLADSQPENAGPFLREVLFGEEGPERSDSLELVDQLVARIAALLAPYGEGFKAEMALEEASRWVVSALVSDLLQDVVGRPSTDRRATLRARVRVLLRGLGVPT